MTPVLSVDGHPTYEIGDLIKLNAYWMVFLGFEGSVARARFRRATPDEVKAWRERGQRAKVDA